LAPLVALIRLDVLGQTDIDELRMLIVLLFLRGGSFQIFNRSHADDPS